MIVEPVGNVTVPFLLHCAILLKKNCLLACKMDSKGAIKNIPPLSLTTGRLIPDSPADRCGQLYMYDELLAVNGQDVSQMDHGDIVTLIKASSTQIDLNVQQPEDLDAVTKQQMVRLWKNGSLWFVWAIGCSVEAMYVYQS